VTQCRPVSDMVWDSRLRFFGHVARTHPTEVHRRAVQAAMQKPPSSWKRPQAKLDMASSGHGQRQPNELWHSYRLAEGSWPRAMASHRGHSNAPAGVGYVERREKISHRHEEHHTCKWQLYLS